MPKFAGLAALAMALPLLSGGLYVQVAPPNSPDAKTKGAFIVAQLDGCHEAEKGKLVATAEGLVGGKRETIELKPVALGRAGAFAIPRQWPAEGRWVVKLVGSHPAFEVTTTTLVKISGDGYDRGSVVMKMGDLQADALEKLLR